MRSGSALTGRLVWLITFLVFRYASLASILAGIALPIAAIVFGYPLSVILFAGLRRPRSCSSTARTSSGGWLNQSLHYTVPGQTVPHTRVSGQEPPMLRSGAVREQPDAS